MAVRLTYFVHASTTDSDSGIATGWLPGELSARGREQAAELGRLVRVEDFDAVFCSDLARAIESARIVFGGRFEAKADARLRECNFGDLNGTPGWRFKDRLVEYISTPFPDGESYPDVERRVAAFVQELRTTYEGKRVAVIAHQAPQLALDVLLGGKTWQQAIGEDWRRVGSWQPGWDYVVG